jgi:hypothetical protein
MMRSHALGQWGFGARKHRPEERGRATFRGTRLADFYTVYDHQEENNCGTLDQRPVR